MNTKPMLTAVAAALFSLGACVSAQAADLSTCTTCHSNITKAHAGAAHKDIACTSCHSGVDQHLKKVTDRPTVNMDPGYLRRLPIRRSTSPSIRMTAVLLVSRRRRLMARLPIRSLTARSAPMASR